VSGHHIQLELVNKVESVQRRFTKRFLCCYGLTYSQRLTKLGIERLELRWLHLDLVYVYKILFGMVETEVSTHFVRRKLDTGTRGHSLKLFAHHSRIDARKHSFCNRIVQCWNSLPATPTDFSSLTCCRRFLGRTDLSRFRIGKD